MYALVFSEFAAWFMSLETVKNIFIAAVFLAILVPAFISLWSWRDGT